MTPFLTSKTARYIAEIETYVVAPLQSSSLSDSCYATCMMLFGCMDGLGRLIHENENAGAGERFRYFLSKAMGSLYANRQTELWNLRNALDHNAIAALTYLSHMGDSSDSHLDIWNDWIFINTRQLLNDFTDALTQLKKRFETDSILLSRADERLTLVHIPASGWRDSGVLTTPPPGIDFLK